MNRKKRENRAGKNKTYSKKNIKIISGIITAVILLLLIVVGANTETLNKFSNMMGLDITFENKQEDEKENYNREFVSANNLKVYFIDVGQADSILILNGTQSMLIDAGNNEDGKDVVKFIKDKGVTKLNYVIGTHPHEDHIGGLDDVIDSFDVENIYMPKIGTTTKTFEDVLDIIENKKISITSPKKGDKFNVGEANCEVMTDPILDENNLNLSSITIRLQFGNNSFLFMGDSETQNEITRQWPKTDVLKVAHHGSDTSTSDEFLNQVAPKISVIMVGKDNSYGLPKYKIIHKIEKIGSKIYRTDKNGTIEMISDGNNILTN